MRDFALVKKIEGQLVEVVPLVSDACISCTTNDCAKQGKPFSVLNKRNLPIAENSIVKIGVSRLSQCLQGISALLLPILSAIVGFLFSPVLAQRFGFEFSEGFQALTVLVFLFVPSLIVFIINRSNIHISLPEITKVL
ncbi:MAG: SoxR reducing system RseC family protein [Treponema sp.]|nr:SoxR reducing system RseC family protein [Candidatus Treponema equifaecale]